MEQIGVEIVHAGICTRKHDGSECSQITKILSKMEEKGMKVVRGTH